MTITNNPISFDYNYVQRSIKSKSNPNLSLDFNSYNTNSNKIVPNPNVWEEIGQKYNIHKATFDEFCQIAKMLYDAGEISDTMYADMTFDEALERDSNVGIRKALGLDENFIIDGNMTAADKYGCRDWIAEFRERANWNFKHNFDDSRSYILNNHLADVLSMIPNKSGDEKVNTTDNPIAFSYNYAQYKTQYVLPNANILWGKIAHKYDIRNATLDEFWLSI